jgi:hypothetical protein
MNFKIKACSVEIIEQEIEAENQEKAEDLFLEKYENGDIGSEEGTIFFEGDEGFKMISEIVFSEEE